MTLSGDLAVVRLVWTLVVRVGGKAEPEMSDEVGMEVFRREAGGVWRIVRNIAFRLG